MGWRGLGVELLQLERVLAFCIGIDIDIIVDECFCMKIVLWDYLWSVW